MCTLQTVLTNDILFPQPRDLILPSGKRFSFDYDNTGLTSIRLPGGGGGSNNLMTISVQSGLLGVRKVYLSLPGLSEPFVTYWKDESTLLQIRTPSGDGNVLHKYTALGLLKKTASGDSLSLYDYNDENLLTSVTHTRERKFTLKITLVRDIVNLPQGT